MATTSVGSAFRAAVEAEDLEAALALLAPDVVFHTPVLYKPLHGREGVRPLLTILFETFEDFRYVGELDGDGLAGLVFEARVGDRELEGIDLLRADADGLVADFTVMIRPYSALTAVKDAVGSRLASQSAS